MAASHRRFFHLNRFARNTGVLGAQTLSGARRRAKGTGVGALGIVRFRLLRCRLGTDFDVAPLTAAPLTASASQGIFTNPSARTRGRNCGREEYGEDLGDRRGVTHFPGKSENGARSVCPGGPKNEGSLPRKSISSSEDAKSIPLPYASSGYFVIGRRMSPSKSGLSETRSRCGFFSPP